MCICEFYLYEVGKKQDVGGGRPHGFPRESLNYRITTHLSPLYGPAIFYFFLLLSAHPCQKTNFNYCSKRIIPHNNFILQINILFYQ